MKNKNFLAILIIFFLNIFLRVLFVIYGYIPSEEGMLIYGQKLAYSGLLPFIHYNAWNSLLNNYIIGLYQFFISPTIITQRIIALLLSCIVFFLVFYISKNLKKEKTSLFSAFLLTFGSFTYLYYSTIPTSEQTMTLSLIISFALLSKMLTSKKHHLFLSIFAFTAALLAFPIRPQALPATLIIWVYIFFYYRKQVKKFFVITVSGLFFLFCIYLPFMMAGWDNFIYSIIWPLKAQDILVYQYGITAFKLSSLIPFTVNAWKEYSIVFIFLGAVVIAKTVRLKQTINAIKSDNNSRFIFFSFLAATSMASLSLLHKPMYSTYIYPSVPIFAYVAGFYIASFFEKIKGLQYRSIRMFFYSICSLISFQYLITFPHTDYMKTSLATITSPPYVLLKEIHAYIESKTSPGSEILSFYVPAVAELNRVIPKDLNEGEGSISILSTEDSLKHNLTNVEMLKTYISTQKAQAIVMVSITPRFFGISEKERNETMETLQKYYVLDKIFTNFYMIGNPRVPTLSFYLKKN